MNCSDLREIASSTDAASRLMRVRALVLRALPRRCRCSLRFQHDPTAANFKSGACPKLTVAALISHIVGARAASPDLNAASTHNCVVCAGKDDDAENNDDNAWQTKAELEALEAEINAESLVLTRAKSSREPPSSLILPLLPYQKEFLSWAIEQETGLVRGGILAGPLSELGVHGWNLAHAIGGNAVCAPICFKTIPPQRQHIETEVTWYADEMGLGKTLQVCVSFTETGSVWSCATGAIDQSCQGGCT